MKYRRFLINAFLIAVIATLVTAARPPARALASGGTSPLKIYAFGDSITYGFADTGAQSLTNSGSFRTRLAGMLRDAGIDARIVNGGVPGETTADARARFNRIFLEKPDAVIIMFGTNDCSAGADGKAKVALESYRAALEFFIRELQAKDIGVVLMTPPPLPTENIPVLNNRRLKPYVFAARETAIRNRIDLVDNFANFNDAASGGNLMRFFLADAIHPNEEGHKLIAEGLFDVFNDEGSRLNQRRDGWKFYAGADGDESAPAGKGENEEDDEDVDVPGAAVERKIRSGANVALGGSYIESAGNKNCRPGALTDGEADPKDRSGAYFTSDAEEFPKWVLIDLGKTLEVKKIRVYNTSSLDARNVTVYYSREPGRYTPAGSGIFRRPSSRLDFILKKSVKARYVKIEIEDSYGGKNRVSLAEVEVFGAR